MSTPALNTRPRVCLNMIVKNESAVIERCLDSVLPIIDTWVIVDTGSTDGTQDLIRRKLAQLPGELHERPWVNFGHNRSEAAALAQDQPNKADYLLFFDADDVLARSETFKLPLLTADAYQLWINYNGMHYTRVMLVSTRLRWHWVGVVHEYPHAAPPARTIETLAGAEVIIRPEGARSRDPKKFHRDAELLERALIDEPENPRYVFYLAQSYRDAGETEKALRTYERRIAMSGWEEETWYARWQAARMAEFLKHPPAEVIERYLDAFQARPRRVEPLVDLARMERQRGNLPRAYVYAAAAMRIDRPSGDILFVDAPSYDWRRQDELAVAAYWIGHYEESKQLSAALLASGHLPASERPRIEANMNFATNKINEAAGNRP